MSGNGQAKLDDQRPARSPDYALAERDQLERLVCSALCWWKAGVEEALDAVSARDFHHGRWRTVFEALAQLHEDRRPLTLAELSDVLDDQGRLDAAGGIVELAKLFHGQFPGASAVLFARLLADRARRERLTAAALRIADRAANDDVDPDEAAAELAQHVGAHEHGIDRAEDVRADVTKAPSKGLTAGWRDLDRLYRVEPGLFTVVTGIGGAGKSTFVGCLAMRLVDLHGWRFAVFSPENAPTARHVRILAALHAQRPVELLSDAEVDDAVGFVGEHFEWINSTEGLDLDEILRRADVIHRRRLVNGLVIDPWNEIDRDTNDDSETLRISVALTKLRRWARRRSVHVWVVAHPRKMQRRANGDCEVPSLYDVAHSSTFSDKADMGVVVHRSKVRPDEPTTVYVVKVRFADHGRIGSAQLRFEPGADRLVGMDEGLRQGPLAERGFMDP